jgi:hypothetical protein
MFDHHQPVTCAMFKETQLALASTTDGGILQATKHMHFRPYRIRRSETHVQGDVLSRLREYRTAVASKLAATEILRDENPI